MAHWLFHAISNEINPVAMSGFSRDMFQSPFFPRIGTSGISRERPLSQKLESLERLARGHEQAIAPFASSSSIALNHPRGIVDLRTGPGNSRPRGV